MLYMFSNRQADEEKKELSAMLEDFKIPEGKKVPHGKGTGFLCAHDSCDKVCKRKADYKKHYRTHFDFRPFKCRIGDCKWAAVATILRATPAACLPPQGYMAWLLLTPCSWHPCMT